MDNLLFDNAYIAGVLLALNDFIEDLEKWSVYNEDKHADDIQEIKAKISELQGKIRMEVIKQHDQ